MSEELDYVIIGTHRVSKARKVVYGPMTKKSAMDWSAGSGLKKFYKDFRYAIKTGKTAKRCLKT